MKKALLIVVACLSFAACNSGQSEREKEKADSIAAERAADSMLNAAATDTLGADSVKAAGAAELDSAK
jgi:hypothetical protein